MSCQNHSGVKFQQLLEHVPQMLTNKVNKNKQKTIVVDINFGRSNPILHSATVIGVS